MSDDEDDKSSQATETEEEVEEGEEEGEDAEGEEDSEVEVEVEEDKDEANETEAKAAKPVKSTSSSSSSTKKSPKPKEKKSSPKKSSKPKEKTPTKTPTKTPSKEATSTTKSSKKAPSSAAKSPKSPKSVGYVDLVYDAIVALKDRTGSSQPAIQKYILANNPNMHPERVKKQLKTTLKTGVKNKRFVKIKASFKIHPDYKKKIKAASKKAKAAAKAKKVKKPTAAELAAKREKERLAAKEKARLERIRKRKFPMEDMKLIAEDKELKVTVSLPSRPTLNAAIPEAPAACKSDSMRGGLLDDVFHVYHFFRGDVGWGLKEKNGVAPFTMEQWLECVKQVLTGASKRAKLLPPLMTHLFIVALQNLVPTELQAALTPASWSEILMLYMDAMDRHEQNMMEKSNALPGLGIDTDYLFEITDEAKAEADLEEAAAPPSTYLKSLRKTHTKLFTQDPWMLTADELLTLLRTLVDDLLASSPESALDLDVRLEETVELFHRKRSAELHCRKLQMTRNKEQKEEKSDRQENAENGAKSTRSNTKKTTVSEAQLESARRAQQKTTDAYEKACKSRPIRTERIGQDRHFNEVYHFWNDPQRVFILQKGKNLPSVPYKLPGLETYKTNWQSIDKRSVLESYLESLDVRGERESGLYDALRSATKVVHDDIKVANEKKAVLKEKMEIQRKLENAKLKCEFGRKSGRLAAQSEEEFAALQSEIDLLEESIAKGKEVVKPDLEELTGMNMLRDFDGNKNGKGRRATRRDTQKQKEDEEEDKLPRFQCSRMWSSGNIDGTGIIGSIVCELLQLEERVESLASCEADARKAWISSLETTVHSWHLANPPVIEEVGGISAPASPLDDESKAKKPRLSETPMTPEGGSNLSSSQVITMLRQPLLALEDRIFGISGLAMAAKDADEADDNMSTNPEEEEEEQLQLAWKKLVNRIRHLPAKAHAKIRQAVVEAIAAARKAQSSGVVAELRDALLQYHPHAAGACKAAALLVLEQHGGYDDADDDDEDDEMEVDQEQGTVQVERETEGGLSTALSAEAVILNSSLDGSEDASRGDWIFAVKKAKTISKLAALAAGFCTKASEKLERIETEQETLNKFIDVWEKATALRKKASKEELTETPEVWANVTFTDDFCLAKGNGYPWWPAKKCVAKDKKLSESLEKYGRVLVSLVGESGGLRAVKTEDILPFSEELPEDENLSDYPKETRSQLEDCMTMTRRIIRGKERKGTKSSSKKKKSIGQFNDFKEEKKLST